MLDILKRYALLYFLFVVIFFLQRTIFLSVYYASLGDCEVGEVVHSLFAGYSLDFGMAGYFVALPLLLGMVHLWYDHKILAVIEKVYFVILSIMMSLVTVLDTGLYSYWGFRLDMTPFFYFLSSPASAMASATVSEMVLAPIVFILLSAGMSWLFVKFCSRFPLCRPTTIKNRVVGMLTALIVCGLLFITIRGGVTVSTMNLSRAYFSQNPRLNHVAINPQFSLMYSLTHQSNFGEQFRYMDAEDAKTIFDSTVEKNFVPTDSLLSVKNPDIYLIIAESFSAHLMPCLGGEPIAMRLDSIARHGMLFTNIYASSFRTDRAIPAILSAFPAQPTMSLMKYVEKAENLPSLPKTLKQNGYELSYYYGGDINFTNMLAYVVSQGFDNIVKDKDFTIEQRKSKWGAHDDVVFSKLKNDVSSMPESTPKFVVLQTSSSHEPFKVPFTKELKIRQPEYADRANAFAFADSCIGDFVDFLRDSGRWEQSLVVVVPDHYGAYPVFQNSCEEILNRHHIPLVVTGGALRVGEVKNDTFGSQTDIVATILSMLNIENDEFCFSRNLFDETVPHFAFFTEPEFMVVSSSEGVLVYNIEASRIELVTAPDTGRMEALAKAYIQTVYDTIEKL